MTTKTCKIFETQWPKLLLGNVNQTIRLPPPPFKKDMLASTIPVVQVNSLITVQKEALHDQNVDKLIWVSHLRGRRHIDTVGAGKLTI